MISRWQDVKGKSFQQFQFLLNSGFEQFSLLHNPNDIAVGKVIILSISYLTFWNQDFSKEILTGELSEHS